MQYIEYHHTAVAGCKTTFFGIEYEIAISQGEKTQVVPVHVNLLQNESFLRRLRIHESTQTALDKELVGLAVQTENAETNKKLQLFIEANDCSNEHLLPEIQMPH